MEKPNPEFAKLLQQAIGGIEGEIRVCLQYLFQAWNNRGPMKYRDMLLETGTEEIAHIDMLATAVALNLEGAATALKEKRATSNPLVEAMMGDKDPATCCRPGSAPWPPTPTGCPSTAPGW